jgi:hypothetical protein
MAPLHLKTPIRTAAGLETLPDRPSLVTPGLDPGAQAATIVASRSRLVLDARVKPAHDG